MRDISLKRQEEASCQISHDIKMSKESHLIAIPLIKEHLFGSGQYKTIEFVFFDTTNLNLAPNKLQINI